jgi:hypothetical protein
MTPKNNEMLVELKAEMTGLKTDLNDLKTEFQKEKEVNKAGYIELLSEIRNQNYVLNHHREKMAKNEEELSKLREGIQS